MPPPPEHRLQAPLVGSGSSRGAMIPPEHRLKAPLVGSGFSGGAMAPPERRGKGTGSIGETPLANLSNLIGPQRVDRERKYTRPWSSSKQRMSAKTCHRRFSLLPPTSQAHLRNTAGAAAGSFRYPATRLHPQPLPLEKPGTGLSGGRMPLSPSASLSGARMPSSPSASLSGARMLPSPRLTVKPGAGLIIETPREHQLATSSPRKHQALTGSPRKHQAAMSSPQKHQAAMCSPHKQQAATGSPRKHQAVTGSPQKHQAVSSPHKHGEDISYEEFEGYLERLPCMPAHVDTSLRPNSERLNELQVRNILYHIKYCKFTRQMHMDDDMLYKLDDDHPLYLLEEKLECLEDDISKLEGDNLLYYLEKEGLLRQIENDELFDWSFNYRTIDGLDDYQRLIPQNYGHREYVRWDTYRDYFHSYELELEYLMYWKELLKELKWMEDYVLLKPSLKWGEICTRGCYQAVKIASRFSKITESLARGAYYDCIDTMCLDIIWYKELDGVYFEIWQRMTMLKENFKEALNEVFKSDKFPLRRQKMEDALENDCSEMEKEYRACTAGITAEVKEDSGRELIADAIKNQRGRPKFYAQYIRKKIEVAKAIGVIPAVVT